MLQLLLFQLGILICEADKKVWKATSDLIFIVLQRYKCTCIPNRKLIFPTEIKVRNRHKMLTKGAHNMKNSIILLK